MNDNKPETSVDPYTSMEVSVTRTPGYTLHIMLPTDLFGEAWFDTAGAKEIPTGVNNAVQQLIDEIVKWRMGFGIKSSGIDASEPPTT